LSKMIAGSPFIVIDSFGSFYDYGQEGFYDEEPGTQASEWLGVITDYYD